MGIGFLVCSRDTMYACLFFQLAVFSLIFHYSHFCGNVTFSRPHGVIYIYIYIYIYMLHFMRHPF